MTHYIIKYMLESAASSCILRRPKFNKQISTTKSMMVFDWKSKLVIFCTSRETLLLLQCLRLKDTFI